MEVVYLKSCLACVLPKLLSEVCLIHPSDPILYISELLYHYRKIHPLEIKTKLNIEEETLFEESFQVIKLRHLVVVCVRP